MQVGSWVGSKALSAHWHTNYFPHRVSDFSLEGFPPAVLRQINNIDEDEADDVDALSENIDEMLMMSVPKTEIDKLLKLNSQSKDFDNEGQLPRTSGSPCKSASLSQNFHCSDTMLESQIQDEVKLLNNW